ncbi:MAG: hypothetical protein K0Q97_2407 [Bacillota bacterium]|nr:hypothetical protein [Bacillota bacterium]
MVKIYLSPSNQPNNKYIVGDTNEKAEMEAVAKIIKSILDKEYDCETFLATLNLGTDLNERTAEAKSNGCDIYLAIHSNAGGNNTASGAVAFYHPDSTTGKLLATNIVNELGVICPIESNRINSVINGMNAFGGIGYGEIRNPSSVGLTAVIAETDFHDNPLTAKWIIENKNEIARAYVNAIVKIFNINNKTNIEELEEVEEVAVVIKYYKVQVGAFSSKENAEKLLEKVKSLGFEDAFIQYN